MSTLEVCTWDFGTGTTVVDHSWTITNEKDSARVRAEAEEWARKAAQFDKSTDHTVFVREV